MQFIVGFHANSNAVVHYVNRSTGADHLWLAKAYSYVPIKQQLNILVELLPGTICMLLYLHISYLRHLQIDKKG